MNPNYSPTAAAAAERAMEEKTQQTTEQMEKDRLSKLPDKVKQDAVNRVLDALESHPFRKALISQHLEVKHISSAVNGRVIVTLGSLPESQDPVQLEILTDDPAPYEDKNLVFEFMLAPRKVADDTVKVANSGHGPEVDPILENPIETQGADNRRDQNTECAECARLFSDHSFLEAANCASSLMLSPERSLEVYPALREAAVSVALPEKEHVTVHADAEEDIPIAETTVIDLPKEDYQFSVESPSAAFVVKDNELVPHTPEVTEPNPDWTTPADEPKPKARKRKEEK